MKLSVNFLISWIIALIQVLSGAIPGICISLVAVKIFMILQHVASSF
jgi:hypothetical protein